MALNAAGGVEIPLTVFGSLVTEMSPSDCPEGVSPDNVDVVYAPGNVQSRPALQRVFAAQFAGGAVTWLKTFFTPAGGIENLYLDAGGQIWWEDFNNNPGNYVALYKISSPNSFGKSVTAFGREYITFSDGLSTAHGTDKPVQWDGTNIDPVTQYGPGAPPVVATISLPSVAMVATGGPTNITLTECDPAGQGPGGSFTQINCFTNTNLSGLIFVGSTVTITGNSSGNMNQANLSVIAVYPNGNALNLFVVSAYLPAGTTFGLGGNAQTSSGVTMTRANNVVTVTTAVAHQLQPGYQALIAGMSTALPIGGGILGITIFNEVSPGVAQIKCNSAHGLIPGIQVAINGVKPAVLGTTISNVARAGGIVTVTLAAAPVPPLYPGAIVTIAGCTTAAFNTTAPVLSVPNPTTFTYAQTDADASEAETTATASINWPLPASSLPTLFTVTSIIDSLTFQVAVSYSNGSWQGGSVSSATLTFGWNGTFFVSSVPNATTFTYQQLGPNGTASQVGSVQPYGQAAPGLHQCQVLFLTRNGYITRPSPPTTFFANGGQYVSLSNIPIGPANVVARILAFTGAGGASFFYIPVPAQVNNQLVSTATQINDNVSTGAFLDFSDNTLFASLGISIPGNNFANQIILDSALGFGFYGSRLITWGQRNTIQNLLNLDFMGGTQLPQALPTGWKVPSGQTASGNIVSGGSGGPGGQAATAWHTTGAGGSIYQSFYQDAYGAPIATPNTQYRARAWLAGGGSVSLYIQESSGVGFQSTVVLNSPGGAGGWVEGVFSLPMPATIPSDLNLYLFGSGATVSQISIIYNKQPFLDTIIYGSYVNNPEAFDGVSGKFGAVNDRRKVMDMAILRQALYFLTQDPSGRIHQTSDNGATEPAGWTISELAANCGLLSPFCLTKSQADDASAGGGEEWFAWASSSGARIFGGDQPWKISQEIQPDWDSINSAFVGSTWAVNDPSARVIYFGLVIGSGVTVYPLNYRQLDTPYQIATSAPYHPSFAGHLIATDNTRKWTRWRRNLTAAALMYRGNPAGNPIGAASLSMVFGGHATGGNNANNVYTLNATRLTDDDFGQIFPYYTIYFTPSHAQEQSLMWADEKGQRHPLGSGRKLLMYLMAYATGTGLLNITVYADNLNNPWPITGQRTLQLQQNYDLEWPGGNAYAQRFAIKFASAPIQGQTDNGFSLQKVIAVMRTARRAPVRGAA